MTNKKKFFISITSDLVLWIKSLNTVSIILELENRYLYILFSDYNSANSMQISTRTKDVPFEGANLYFGGGNMNRKVTVR